jgi:hypothetical protein
VSNLESVYGPAASADYQPGACIRFLRDGLECCGDLLHVRAPGPAVQGGKSHPTLYVIDDGSGWPVHVPASQILETKEED